MATIHIDGKKYEVDGSDNLLAACLSLGLDVPYFCWHPALGSMGSCRQCAVKQYADEHDTRGRLVMSCMTPASDKTYISIDDEEAVAFRKSVVEWLMTNHPHDCPVCAEGGHCHLQDMTVMTGHNFRRYRFNKRTHANQELGPFIRHEMNRCIACYRCVRYYKDYAGGQDLGVYGAHDQVYFGRPEDGVLESEFSGNLTEVCPTGVFTDKTSGDHYARKWDMQYAPSICQGCAVGCNISPGERYGMIRRIENRYHGEVNHYFLCDRGRFGYGFTNRADRPMHSTIRREAMAAGAETAVVVGIDAALDEVAGQLRKAKGVVGIGSARASLETNLALSELVGPGHFSSGWNQEQTRLYAEALSTLQLEGVKIPSLRAMESADAVLLVGEDVTQTAPRVALAVRQAAKTRALQRATERKVPTWNAEPVKNIAQRELSPVYILDVQPGKLADIADTVVIGRVAEQVRMASAIAHVIDAAAPAVSGLSATQQQLAKTIAAGLLAAKQPLLIGGCSAGEIGLVQALRQVAVALVKAGKQPLLSMVLPEVNTAGLAMLESSTREVVLRQLQTGEADTLIVVENDLYRLLPEAEVNELLGHVRYLVVVDHQLTRTAGKAQALLAAASFAEADGTVVSMEGRAQRYFKVYEPSYYQPEKTVRESWRWLHALKNVAEGAELTWTTIDAATAVLAEKVPALAQVVNVAPQADYRILGLKIAREPRRYSGRTAMRANINVHEPRQPQDENTALTFSMEGYTGPQEDSALIPFAWAPGWNSPSAWNKYQNEVGGSLRQGNSGVCLWEGRQATAGYLPLPAERPSLSDDCFEIAPVYHLFGSDELSARAEAVQERIPSPYVLMHPSVSPVAEGQQVQVTIGAVRFDCPVRYSDTLAQRCIGLPQGLVPVYSGNSAVISAAAGGAQA